MAKGKALYECKVVAVPDGFLYKLNSIILNAVCEVKCMPQKHGSRNVMQGPTFMRGFQIKSMKNIYYEAVIMSYFKLLHSEDTRLKEII